MIRLTFSKLVEHPDLPRWVKTLNGHAISLV